MKTNFIFLIFLAEFIVVPQNKISALSTEKNFLVDGIRYEVLKDDTNSVAVTKNGRWLNHYSGDIVIPNSIIYLGKTYNVTVIGEKAFADSNSRDSITSITLPNCITKIEDEAFLFCSRVKYIQLPKSLTFIGDNAFYGSALDKIHIPKNVTYIGNSAFNNPCLYSFSVDQQNMHYSSMDGVLFNKDTTCLISFPQGRKMSTYSIPSTVRKLADKSFMHCDIHYIKFPEALKEVGKSAFWGLKCDSISKNNIQHIGDSAFMLARLISVNLSDSLKTIGKRAFAYNYSLKEVFLPANLTHISEGAFEGCRFLTSVIIPEGVTSIGKSAFFQCDSLLYITMPNSVIYIESSTAFSYTAWYRSQPKGPIYAGRVLLAYKWDKNKKLKIIIPDSIVSISSDVFPHSIKITYMSIPSSVEQINWHAFSRQSIENINKIDLWWQTPPELSSFRFSEKNNESSNIWKKMMKRKPLLIVPKGTIDEYQKYWYIKNKFRLKERKN